MCIRDRVKKKNDIFLSLFRESNFVKKKKRKVRYRLRYEKKKEGNEVERDV